MEGIWMTERSEIFYYTSSRNLSIQDVGESVVKTKPVIFMSFGNSHNLNLIGRSMGKMLEMQFQFTFRVMYLEKGEPGNKKFGG